MRSFRLALVPENSPNAGAVLTAKFLPDAPAFGQLLGGHFVVKWREEPPQLALLRRLLERWRDYHAGRDDAPCRASLQAATAEFLTSSRLIGRAVVRIDDDQEVQGRMLSDLRAVRGLIYSPKFHSLEVRPSML